MAPAPAALRALPSEDGIALGALDHLCIALWRGPVTRTRFQAQRAALAAVVEQRRGGVGFLCVIEPTASPPDDELRKASAAMVKEFERSFLAIACVVEGSGFVSAVGRSALSAIALLLGSRRYPLGIHGTTRAAAAWLTESMPALDPRAIDEAVDALRASMPPWPPGAR